MDLCSVTALPSPTTQIALLFAIAVQLAFIATLQAKPTSSRIKSKFLLSADKMFKAWLVPLYKGNCLGGYWKSPDGSPYFKKWLRQLDGGWQAEVQNTMWPNCKCPVSFGKTLDNHCSLQWRDSRQDLNSCPGAFPVPACLLDSPSCLLEGPEQPGQWPGCPGHGRSTSLPSTSCRVLLSPFPFAT